VRYSTVLQWLLEKMGQPIFYFSHSYMMAGVVAPAERRPPWIWVWVAGCSFQQLAALQQWQADFLGDLRRSPTFALPQSGGFVESCLEHVAAQMNRGIDGIQIAGVSMRQALSAWWNDDGVGARGGIAAAAGTHWHLPCTVTQAAPHQCNPTCAA
jgi:hypothetical protein